ncbi:hypothetical protein ACFSGX_06635 [Sphingomonas arantia]|uniref:Integron n=1 Tax=Sphingomonas arantia TaxID=1460676 RepID=A0ABW4TZI9_9SPHN
MPCHGAHAVFAVITLAAVQPAAAAPAVAVRIGGDAELDACPSLGAVVGLDPKGDNFLSVRSGPGGTPYRETDRIGTGRRVAICADRGAWLGIVYPQGDGPVNCGVATPVPRPSAYRGPCRSGWVHRRHVRVIAG